MPPLVWHFLVRELLHVQVSAAEFTVSLFTFLTVLSVGEDSLYAAHGVLSSFFLRALSPQPPVLGATATG